LSAVPHPARLQEAREVGALAQLGDAQFDRAGSWDGRNHHNLNEHPRSPKVGREASPRRRVCRIDPLVPNGIVIFEQTHVSDPDLGA
jgi:hypothetical protein